MDFADALYLGIKHAPKGWVYSDIKRLLDEVRAVAPEWMPVFYVNVKGSLVLAVPGIYVTEQECPYMNKFQLAGIIYAYNRFVSDYMMTPDRGMIDE